MNYKFDNYGWYCGVGASPTPRSTEIAPDDLQVHNDAGQPRSNFTGVRWVMLPYQAPPPQVVDVSGLIAVAIKKIDIDTDAIYGDVLGNRAEEYTLAAAEALAYKSAGYAGSVPGSVQSWAAAKGWTATQATDDILLTATQWSAAQSAIRAQRLACKEQVRNATNAAGIATVLTAWAGFVVYMRDQLEV